MIRLRFKRLFRRQIFIAFNLLKKQIYKSQKYLIFCSQHVALGRGSVRTPQRRASGFEKISSISGVLLLFCVQYVALGRGSIRTPQRRASGLEKISSISGALLLFCVQYVALGLKIIRPLKK